MKLKTCERMGWLFTDYETQPADEIFLAWQMWAVENKVRAGTHPDEGYGEWEE
jgi:hypothetical protein